ncbi:MAG: ArsR family transcriptional regulator [Candidatus Heimdallarchaeota archaeon]|nr:ArsR family transcriptional regulator [Candidatus Heimdallarchaeota archaeon]
MLGKNDQNRDLDVFELLDFLSNSTRRRILELLSEEDLYSFQLSRLLDISPRIIAKYLSELEGLGIVSMIERDSDKGPTRKYAKLNQSFSLIIDVGQNTFDVKYVPTDETVVELKEEHIKKQEKIRSQITKELSEIRESIKEKAEEITKLNQQRKNYVQEINEAFSRFNNIIEKTVYDYNDRIVIRSIFKVLINQPENKVSLTALARKMRLWRGDLGERLQYIAEKTELIRIETDRNGEVWYSI